MPRNDANRVLTRCTKKHRYSMTSSARRLAAGNFKARRLSGSQCHFRNRRDRAPVAPIRMGTLTARCALIRATRQCVSRSIASSATRPRPQQPAPCSDARNVLPPTLGIGRMSTGMPFVLHLFSRVRNTLPVTTFRQLPTVDSLDLNSRSWKEQENRDERKRRDRGLSGEYAVHEQLIKRFLQSFCLPAEKRA